MKWVDILRFPLEFGDENVGSKMKAQGGVWSSASIASLQLGPGLCEGRGMEYSQVGRRELTPDDDKWGVTEMKLSGSSPAAFRADSLCGLFPPCLYENILLLGLHALCDLVNSLTLSCKYEAIKVCFSCIFTCVSNETLDRGQCCPEELGSPGDFSTVVSSGRRQQVREGNKTVLFWVPGASTLRAFTNNQGRLWVSEV